MNQCEDKSNCPWTEEQLERFADLVADKAIERIREQTYLQVGKAFMSKIYYVAGACLVGLYFYLQSKGMIK